MMFGGCIEDAGPVDLHQVETLAAAVESNFKDDWVDRSLHKFSGAHVLRIESPSERDRLPPDRTAELRRLVTPFWEALEREDQVIVYADISRVPPGGSIGLHVDLILLQTLSRRIHIPLTTNEGCVMAFVNENGIETYHMPVGRMYHVNNCVPHLVRNTGKTGRMHLLFDVMDRRTHELFKDDLLRCLVSPVTNYIISREAEAKASYAAGTKARFIAG